MNDNTGDMQHPLWHQGIPNLHGSSVSQDVATEAAMVAASVVAVAVRSCTGRSCSPPEIRPSAWTTSVSPSAGYASSESIRIIPDMNFPMSATTEPGNAGFGPQADPIYMFHMSIVLNKTI